MKKKMKKAYGADIFCVREWLKHNDIGDHPATWLAEELGVSVFTARKAMKEQPIVALSDADPFHDDFFRLTVGLPVSDDGGAVELKLMSAGYMVGTFVFTQNGLTFNKPNQKKTAREIPYKALVALHDSGLL